MPPSKRTLLNDLLENSEVPSDREFILVSRSEVRGSDVINLILMRFVLGIDITGVLPIRSRSLDSRFPIESLRRRLVSRLYGPIPVCKQFTRLHGWRCGPGRVPNSNFQNCRFGNSCANKRLWSTFRVIFPRAEKIS